MKKVLKLLIFIMLSFSFTCFATPFLEGEKEIILSSSDNRELVIGRLFFTQNDEHINYVIELEDSVFNNEFLSMRPFKCIHKESKMLCHLDYPYKMQGYITEEDMTDLEYDLLFLHKGAADYGIDAWNGLYFKLKLKDGYIEGELNEVDLNVLAAPPEEGVLRPITPDMLYVAEPEQHLFPKMIIK